MKYLIIILLTLGCFKSRPEPDKCVLVETYLHNDRYISIIQDPFSDSELKTLNEYEFRNHLKYHKNNSNLTKIALQYKSLDIKNLEDIVKEIFGENIIKLESNVYQCKKCHIVIIYDRKCNQLSSVEEMEKELKLLKYNIEKDPSYYKYAILYSTNDLNNYEVIAEKAEKLFKN